MTKPILFITRKWEPGVGGMETYSVKITKHLQTKTRIQVLHPKNCNTGRPKLLPLVWFFIRAFFHIIFKGNHYSNIHLGDAVLYPLSFLASVYKLPVFITFHGLDLHYAKIKNLKGRVFKAYLRGLQYAPISCAFPNSSYTGSLIPKRISQIVVPLGTEIPPTPPKPHPPEKTLSICYVGRVIPRKGLSWFIENVIPKLDNCVLHVIGPISVEFKDKHKHPAITWHSWVNDLALNELRKKQDIFIVPNIPLASDVEGFGLVCIENACYGVPVLVSNWQGLTDAVIDGATGFLLRPGVAEDWIQKIEEIQGWSSEAWESYAAKSHKALSYYSWSRVADEYLKNYEKYS